MNDGQARSSALRRHRGVDLVLVIPVYNEIEVLPQLMHRLEAVFSQQALLANAVVGFRVIFVDDGSQDGSADLLAGAASKNIDGEVLVLSRNFGHQAAISAGMSIACGDVVAIMDADLQDPPELILEMLRRWRCGADVVYGVRLTREGALLKRVCYKIFYKIYRIMAAVEVPEDSGDFCLMDWRVVEVLKELREKLRFNRGLRSWVGFRQEGLEYDRPDRVGGDSKYTWTKLYCLATDGLASMSIRPLRVAQFTALLMFASSLVLSLLYTSVGYRMPLERAMPLFAVTQLVVGGVVLLSQYILGAYVGRMYLEVKDRPNFIVRDRFALGSRAASNNKPA